MEKQLRYLVSNTDLERKFKSNISQIKILVYPELNQIRSITTLLPNTQSACFILLKTSENSGHWTCLCRNDTNIYYFDSYGVCADGELNKIAPGVRYELHENTKALTRIIRTMSNGFTFAYNYVQFQEYDPNINTCGKWCYVFCRCVFEGLSLKDFQHRMQNLKDTYDTTYDILVCSLWTSL
jgi:hypothetical protein